MHIARWRWPRASKPSARHHECPGRRIPKITPPNWDKGSPSSSAIIKDETGRLASTRHDPGERAYLHGSRRSEVAMRYHVQVEERMRSSQAAAR